MHYSSRIAALHWASHQQDLFVYVDNYLESDPRLHQRFHCNPGVVFPGAHPISLACQGQRNNKVLHISKPLTGKMHNYYHCILVLDVHNQNLDSTKIQTVHTCSVSYDYLIKCNSISHTRAFIHSSTHTHTHTHTHTDSLHPSIHI